MARKSFRVDLNPALLVWARDTAGYGLSEVAARVSISAAELAAWEAGRRQPSWRSLGKLAAFYKRPVAALLLPKPPEETKTLPDFRRLPGVRGQFSPDVHFAIRTARWLVAKAAELRDRLQLPERLALPSLEVDADPEVAATATRKALGISLEEQAEFGSPWRALKQWRSAVEVQHVHVFQFRMPIGDARGFSLVEMQRPAIVLNQSDAPAARIFTLFHEYAHLLLARPGVCTPELAHFGSSQRIETFCNRFAAAVLLPRADFEKQVPATPAEGVLGQLARRYSVSRYVVLGRMQDCGAISFAAYQGISRRWQAQDAAARRPQGGGGLKATQRCLLERGQPFVSLVVQAAQRDLITFSEANTYLGVKLKDFRQLAKGA